MQVQRVRGAHHVMYTAQCKGSLQDPIEFALFLGFRVQLPLP